MLLHSDNRCVAFCSILTICAWFSVSTVLAVIDGDSTALREVDRISDDNSTFHDLVYRSHIIIVLQCIHYCLQGCYIAVDPVDKSLEIFESLPCRNLDLCAVAEYEQYIVSVAYVHIGEHRVSAESVFSVLTVLTILTGSLSKLLPSASVII